MDEFYDMTAEPPSVPPTTGPASSPPPGDLPPPAAQAARRPGPSGPQALVPALNLRAVLWEPLLEGGQSLSAPSTPSSTHRGLRTAPRRPCPLRPVSDDSPAEREHGAAMSRSFESALEAFHL
eukprot:EG_transcript_47013